MVQCLRNLFFCVIQDSRPAGSSGIELHTPAYLYSRGMHPQPPVIFVSPVIEQPLGPI